MLSYLRGCHTERHTELRTLLKLLTPSGNAGCLHLRRASSGRWQRLRYVSAGFDSGSICTLKQDKQLLLESLPVSAVPTLMQAVLDLLHMAM